MDEKELQELYKKETGGDVFIYEDVDDSRDGIKTMDFFNPSYVEWLEEKAIELLDGFVDR